jgi:hypothetical protein
MSLRCENDLERRRTRPGAYRSIRRSKIVDEAKELTASVEDHAMKNLLRFLVLTAGIVVSLSVNGVTQDMTRTWQNSDPPQSSSATQAKIVVLTGCLERGSGAEEYSLRAGANLWELKSTSVNLGGHLDQMVVVTAVKDNDPYGVLNVIALAMDSNSCNSW